MIVVDREIFVNSPMKLDSMENEVVQKIRDDEQKDLDDFLIPSWVKQRLYVVGRPVHENLLVYKVGFLRDFLKKIYPEKKNDEIYQIIFSKHQVFISNRKMRSCCTLWKKYYLNVFNSHQS